MSQVLALTRGFPASMLVAVIMALIPLAGLTTALVRVLCMVVASG